MTSSSPKKIFPEDGFSNPQIILSVVLFPHPDGPKRPISFPSGISKLKLLTAITSSLIFLLRLGYRLVRFCNTIFKFVPPLIERIVCLTVIVHCIDLSIHDEPGYALASFTNIIVAPQPLR